MFSFRSLVIRLLSSIALTNLVLSRGAHAEAPSSRIILTAGHRVLVENRSAVNIYYFLCFARNDQPIDVNHPEALFPNGQCWALGAPIPNTPATEMRLEHLVAENLEAEVARIRARADDSGRYPQLLAASGVAAGVYLTGLRFFGPATRAEQIITTGLVGVGLYGVLLGLDRHMNNADRRRAHLFHKLNQDHPLSKDVGTVTVDVGTDHQSALPVFGWLIEGELRAFYGFNAYVDALGLALTQVAR